MTLIHLRVSSEKKRLSSYPLCSLGSENHPLCIFDSRTFNWAFLRLMDLDYGEKSTFTLTNSGFNWRNVHWLLQGIVKKIKGLHLSDSTIMRQLENISKDVYDQLLADLHNVSALWWTMNRCGSCCQDLCLGEIPERNLFSRRNVLTSALWPMQKWGILMH